MNTQLLIRALRARLLATEVCTTGTTTLARTGTGFSRPAGSFVDDGFVVGMEVQPTGFADNTPEVITYVDATEIRTLVPGTAETSSAGRALNVRLPTKRGGEGFKLDTDGAMWSMEEEFVPGPGANLVTMGSNGEVEHYPIYIVKLYAPFGYGSSALYKVADAVLESFPPRFVLTLEDSTLVRVRSREGPYRTQAMQVDADLLFTNVYIPLWGRTNNTI